MNRERVSSPATPAPVGPYSSAVKVSGVSEMLFVSGQIGLEPTTGELVHGLDAEVECSMRNLEATLGAAGFQLSDVVRATLYLTDMSTFGRVNELYGAWFSGPVPARVAVEVSALPKGASFEIDAIAVR